MIRTWQHFRALGTGHGEIDGGLDACRAAWTQARAEDGRAAAVAALQQRLVGQFDRERALMAAAAFPNARAHLAEHARVLEIADAAVRAAAAGHSERLARLLDFDFAFVFERHAATMDALLAAWLLDHPQREADGGAACARPAARK